MENMETGWQELIVGWTRNAHWQIDWPIAISVRPIVLQRNGHASSDATVMEKIEMNKQAEDISEMVDGVSVN